MSPEKLTEIRIAEKAHFDSEVAITAEPKFRLLLSHLYVEHLLERYIQKMLKSTDGLFGKNGLSFEKKVCLAQALGSLPKQSIDAIRKLNTMRNDCVHTFKYRPDADRITELARTFGSACKSMEKKANGDPSTLLLACLDRLCGSLLRTVVEAENNGT